MEADLREAGSFEQRLKGTLHDVLRVEGCTDVSSEDEAAVFVEPSEFYALFELALTVRLQLHHSYRPLSDDERSHKP